MEDYKNAVKWFSDALLADLDFAPAYSHLGNTYFQLNQFNKAITNYDNAIRMGSVDPMVYNNRGKARFLIALL